MSTADTAAFRTARDFLLAHREDYATAYRDFRWPRLDEFNWARDWFDGVLGRDHAEQSALRIVEDDGRQLERSFAQLSRDSSAVAAWLHQLGVRRGDRVLMMLGNQVELWEALLAAMKLGAVIIPASTLLGPADLVDRVRRGGVAHVIARDRDAATFAAVPGQFTRIAVGDQVPGWLSFAQAYQSDPATVPAQLTSAADPLLLYFTSGTTAKAKLVEHTHASYPVGALSTMYWIGLRPGDLHLNISSPGWAKHAWSNVFAPWNAAATVLVINQARFAAGALLDALVAAEATTFCAPPTVWRMLIQADLGAWRVPLRECVGAGEPLNPEVIEQVRAAWGITVRDGYGQTETTAQIGNPPGQPLREGSMGRPLPGYHVLLVDPLTGRAGTDGEICLDMSGGPSGQRPLGLMVGYRDDPARTAEVMRDGAYHTGDVASRDGDGYITYVGRTDDVFKASDYRISPFELESVLLEHDAVVEAAVVPSPDPLRLAVPKAYVTLAAGVQPDAATALGIFRFCREHLAPYKRVRRLEFSELPKTISGKIRRVELRGAEQDRHGTGVPSGRAAGEFWEEDFPELTA